MSKEVKTIEDKRMAAENELKELEKLIFRLETNYLKDTYSEGNIIRGWEQLINQKSTKSSIYLSRKNTKTLSEKDRVFSLSSATSPFRQVEEEDNDRGLPIKRKVSASSKKTSSKRKSKARKFNDDDTDFSDATIA